MMLDDGDPDRGETENNGHLPASANADFEACKKHVGVSIEVVQFRTDFLLSAPEKNLTGIEAQNIFFQGIKVEQPDRKTSQPPQERNKGAVQLKDQYLGA